MKFDMSCRVFSVVFTKLLKSFYKRTYPEIDIKDTVKNIKKEYREIIIRTPGLSKDNFMASNLKGAAYFFAVAKKMPNMTPFLMDKMVDESMRSPFMMKINKKKREKGLLFAPKYQNKMKKDAERSQHSNDEMDWRYTFEEGTSKVCAYNITKCGVCKLAEREGLLEYLPCMCKMDYPKYEIAGAKLVRTKTLADGDEVCNFRLERIENESR